METVGAQPASNSDLLSIDDGASRSSSPVASEQGLIGHRVTDMIRDLILSGELVPGSRISQESLAARFGTSRIPVRDALNRLESDGLVVLKPNSGAWVAKLDLNECIEIYKIRERGKALKKRNRTRYYLEKWAVVAALVLFFIYI